MIRDCYAGTPNDFTFFCLSKTRIQDLTKAAQFWFGQNRLSARGRSWNLRDGWKKDVNQTRDAGQPPPTSGCLGTYLNWIKQSPKRCRMWTRASGSFRLGKWLKFNFRLRL